MRVLKPHHLRDARPAGFWPLAHRRIGHLGRQPPQFASAAEFFNSLLDVSIFWLQVVPPPLNFLHVSDNVLEQY